MTFLRYIPVLLAGICLTTSAVAQSPFNYAQNRDIYFVSRELREELEINTLYSVSHLPEHDRGGMNENWNVTVIEFDKNSISDDWSPLSKDSTYNFDFDDLTGNLNFLNGTYYELGDEMLKSYGGGGYGTFDWKEITRTGERISVVATSCTGHCGNEQPVNYSKNVFASDGTISYVVHYPTPDQETDPSLNTSDAEKTEKFLLSGSAADNPPDTIRYYYNKDKLFTGLKSDNKIPEDIISFFQISFPDNLLFHQCYVNDQPMETYFNKFLGYTPRLVLFEIYRYGVFAFIQNPADGKYYRGKDFVLEE